MTKRYNITVIALSLTISAGIWILTLNKEHTNKKNHFAARIFGGPNGWGYDILVNDSLFIRQETIPVLNGSKGFAKKELAEQAAELIINKMKRNQHPAVTTFELQQICPLDKIQYGEK
ncbi:MAG: DUF4907 domain-containing protein [Chitinophagaceae bacterium]